MEVGFRAGTRHRCRVPCIMPLAATAATADLAD
jgi:hypothetical protein